MNSPHSVPLPIRWGEGVRRTGEGQWNVLTGFRLPTDLLAAILLPTIPDIDVCPEIVKKSLLRVLFLLAVMGAGVFAYAHYPYNEPKYQGRRISAWLDDYAAGKNTDFANAIQEVGTNGIPYVIRRLAQNESAPHLKYREYWPKLPAFAHSILPSPRPDL